MSVRQNNRQLAFRLVAAVSLLLAGYLTIQPAAVSAAEPPAAPTTSRAACQYAPTRRAAQARPTTIAPRAS
ncbi:MAG TPA: hypothetical protein VFH48_40555 [Chloroflexota bacterium]|nr:hypothetical protein [Chloroflexota bacterium]